MINDAIKKQKLSATIEPNIKKRVIEEGVMPEFSSASGLVNQALIEFFARRDLRKELEKKVKK